MELKGSIIVTLLLFLLLPRPGFSRGRLHVKSTGSGIYDIDYRGPETHTYIPPPNRAECPSSNQYGPSQIKTKWEKKS